MSDISPLAPEHFPAMPILEGVRLGAGEAAIRYQGRNDLMVALMAAQLAGLMVALLAVHWVVLTAVH